LEFVYGKGAPTDSVIVASQNLNAGNITEILKATPIPYSYLRLNVKPIPEDAKVIIATYSPLDTVSIENSLKTHRNLGNMVVRRAL
jgi:hypothetical protein